LSSWDESVAPEPPIGASGSGNLSAQRLRVYRLLGRIPSWIALTALFLVIPSSDGPMARRINVVVNGTGREIRTPRATVMGILGEAGLSLYSDDVVHPEPAAEVASGQTITLQQARWARVVVDGRAHLLRTQAGSAWELLEEMGIILRPQDRLLVNGQWIPDPKGPDGGPPLAEIRQVSNRGPRAADFVPRPPLEMVIVRAVPVYVEDEGTEGRLLSAATTVAEALHEADIPIYRGDRVEPPLDSQLSAGMRVHIERAVPLTIQVDGGTLHTRTRGESVADVLAQEQISLWDQDIVVPGDSSAVSANMAIRVVRVREETIVEQEAIPFETTWGPNAELPLDQRRVEREGQPGIIARRFRIRYEDGQVNARTLQEEWRAREPQPRLIAYGTKIVSRQIDTPDGPRSYWRKMRVLVTSYSASTSGKSSDHPLFGVTRLGWQMRRGIIAVDPQVINFGTHIYVPGYGVGVSGDTGGKIRGRHIDVGYDDSDLQLWYGWVDVYLLDPPPPSHQIPWVLPDWPKER
jgi:uncharacterized protein YabE (DUF348 family)